MYLKIFVYILIGISITRVLLATTIRVPQDQPTIQAAINAASTGDTILVLPGTYYERIDFLGKNLIVGSLFLTTGNSDYITETIIKKDSLGTVITFSRGETHAAMITGFTIKCGTGTWHEDGLYGGGIFIKKSSPTILNNIITQNSMPSCSNRGGGIAIKDSSNPLILRNTISYNYILYFCDCICYFGGGIWVDSTSNPIIGGSYFDANVFSYNSADYGWDIYRRGNGPIINASYNYFENCSPHEYAVSPKNQFDLSNCMIIPTDVKENINLLFSPLLFQLCQNYPNPFNPKTTISFKLQVSGFISLKVYDMFGREIATLVNEWLNAGKHEVVWSVGNMSSGVYYYQLISENYHAIGKATLIK